MVYKYRDIGKKFIDVTKNTKGCKYGRAINKDIAEGRIYASLRCGRDETIYTDYTTAPQAMEMTEILTL